MRITSPLPRPAYWALDLFAAVMVVALFVAVALTGEPWHRPIEIVWLAVLALGIHLWHAFNRIAAAGTERSERWRAQQRWPGSIYRDDKESE